MNAGELNKIINIYKETIISDDYGCETSSYTIVYKSVRAKMVDGNLFRQVVNDTVYNASSKYFTIRDNYAVKVGMIVKFEGDMFRINAIKELHEQRAIELTTEILEGNVQTDDTESTGANTILLKMPTELRSALSLWYCPIYQHITNSDIKQERFILKDLSGNQRNAKVYHFDGTADSGITNEGHIQFDGDDDFISYDVLSGVDIDGFANPYTGGCFFFDRSINSERTTSEYMVYSVFTTTGAAGIGSASNNYWGEYVTSNKLNTYYGYQWTNTYIPDGVVYANYDPTPVDVANNISAYCEGTINDIPGKVAKKWSNPDLTYRMRSILMGCQKAAYSATTDTWTLTYPAKMLFRSLVWFRRTLTPSEVEWVKNNMFNYEH